MSWKVAGAHIVSEKIADEVIIVDLVDGSYFSLSGCGIAIWEFVKNGYSKDQIVEALSSSLTSIPGDLDQHIETFIASLLEEKLIVPQSGDGVSATVVSGASTVDKTAFEAPSVQKFTDMEDVLKMDPIHDFNELGWPHEPAQPVQPLVS